MSVTKVSDLHESATALDMIRDRTKSIQRENVPVAKLQLQMAGQNDLQVGNAVGHLSVARKIPNVHYILRNNTETNAHFFCLSQSEA